MIQFQADVEPLFEAMGVIEGITNGIKSNAYVDAILNETIAEMRMKFNTDFAALSQSQPQKYHHVWEWGGIGTNPLYYLTKKGKGRTKTVGFNFRQSIKAVPKPDSNETGIPQENIDRLSRRSIFRLKAIVMETGSAVHIQPRDAKVLFVPTPGAKNKNGDVVNFVFRKSVTLRNVGGIQATGAFSEYWVMFWTRVVPLNIEKTILPKVEDNIKMVTEKELGKIRTGGSSRYKSFVMVPVQAMEQAKLLRAEAAEKSLTYYAQSFNNEDDGDMEEI